VHSTRSHKHNESINQKQYGCFESIPFRQILFLSTSVEGQVIYCPAYITQSITDISYCSWDTWNMISHCIMYRHIELDFDDRVFRDRFRFSIENVQFITNLIEPQLCRPTLRSHVIQIKLALWYLTSGSPIRRCVYHDWKRFTAHRNQQKIFGKKNPRSRNTKITHHSPQLHLYLIYFKNSTSPFFQ
jgi:hypothetical protein